MPLRYLLGPVGDMYCLSNTFRMLVIQENLPMVKVFDTSFDSIKGKENL